VRETPNSNKRRKASGFSLLEMLIVIALVFIIASIAIFSIRGALPTLRANESLTTVASVFRQGRELAIAQRRNYQVIFAPPSTLWLRRISVIGELPAGFVDLPQVTIPNRGQFMIYPGVPDTPDAYGNATALSFGGTVTQSFLSDGTFADAAGAPLNGSVYVAIPGDAGTQRAFTILGSTGRIRAYRYTGLTWVLF
jgi:prepilin-type N-terminal cleavage/methylation domain-containing protein